MRSAGDRGLRRRSAHREIRNARDAEVRRHRSFIQDFSVILLANHGAVALGKGIMDAYWKLEIVEAYCATMCVARQMGTPSQVQQSQMEEIFQIKEALGIHDRRIHDPLAARCDVPAPTPQLGMHPGAAAAGPAMPVDLVDEITKAVLERLKK
ncbi:MAG: class II aldolase/adducin family protein [Candidatus Sumerlaeota bacterium]|nr:class II aldolase/adducin family protein [Candidatus Sumerlaeota bacterium]